MFIEVKDIDKYVVPKTRTTQKKPFHVFAENNHKNLRVLGEKTVWWCQKKVIGVSCWQTLAFVNKNDLEIWNKVPLTDTFEFWSHLWQIHAETREMFTRILFLELN